MKHNSDAAGIALLFQSVALENEVGLRSRMAFDQQGGTSGKKRRAKLYTTISTQVRIQVLMERYGITRNLSDGVATGVFQ